MSFRGSGLKHARLEIGVLRWNWTVGYSVRLLMS